MVCVFPGWGGCMVGRLRLVCAFGRLRGDSM